MRLKAIRIDDKMSFDTPYVHTKIFNAINKNINTTQLDRSPVNAKKSTYDFDLKYLAAKTVVPVLKSNNITPVSILYCPSIQTIAPMIQTHNIPITIKFMAISEL